MVQRQRLPDTLRSVGNSVFGPPSPDLVKSTVDRRCSNSGRAGRLELADAVHCLPPKWGRGDFGVHDLRHSFASRALVPGESLTIIGKLFRHTYVQTVPIRSAQTPTIRSMLSGSMRPLTPPYLLGVCDNRIGTVQTTAHYAHLVNESVKASSSRVDDNIGLHSAICEPIWITQRYFQWREHRRKSTDVWRNISTLIGQINR